MIISNRCWFCLMALILPGCNSASPPAQIDRQANLEDYTTIASMASARIAEESFPQPFTYSIERPKATEAVVIVEYGPKPRQQKVLMMKKRDGKWAFEDSTSATQ